jgi:hypothetical protein
MGLIVGLSTLQEKDSVKVTVKLSNAQWRFSLDRHSTPNSFPLISPHK